MKAPSLVLVLLCLAAASANATVLAEPNFGSFIRPSADPDVLTTATVFSDGLGWISSIDISRGSVGPAVPVDSLPGGADHLANDTNLQDLASTARLRLYIADGTSNASRGALIDDVSSPGAAAAVPEPSSLILTAICGCGVLFGLQRLRRKKFA